MSDVSPITRTGPIPDAPRRGSGGKFLAFFLGSEEYGLEILKVQEIIGAIPITRVPRTPDFIRGVVNLRGKIIPVVDLRLKFGMDLTEMTRETCIIVVQAQSYPVGVIVDKVSEVVTIFDEAIEAPPDFGREVDTSYLLGIAKSDGRVRLLLNIERVLSSQDIVDLRALEQFA